MPFKSDSQRRWMYANKPHMAQRWSDETPHKRDLPEKVGTITQKELGGVKEYPEITEKDKEYIRKNHPRLAKRLKLASAKEEALLSLTLAGLTSVPIIAALAYNRKLKKKTMEDRMVEAEIVRMNGIYPLNKVAASPKYLNEALNRDFTARVEKLVKKMRGATAVDRLNAALQGNVDALAKNPRIARGLLAESLNIRPPVLKKPGNQYLRSYLDDSVAKHLENQRKVLADKELQDTFRMLDSTKQVTPHEVGIIQRNFTFPGMPAMDQATVEKLVNPPKSKVPLALLLGLGLPALGGGATGLALGVGRASDRNEALNRTQGVLKTSGRR